MNAKEVVIGGIAAGALALGVACGGASEFTSSPVPDRNDGRVAEAPVRTRATPLSTDSPAPTAVSDPMARPLATPTSGYAHFSPYIDRISNPNHRTRADCHGFPAQARFLEPIQCRPGSREKA